MSNGQARLSFCVSPSVLSDGIGMLTDCPSPTTFVLGLGPTNPPRMTLAAEPSDLRRQGFSPCSRYSSQHSHLLSLQSSSPSTFAARQRSSTNIVVLFNDQFRSFGGTLEPRYIFRTR